MMMKKTLLSSAAVAVTLVVAAGAARAQNGPTDPYGGLEGRIFDAGGGFKLPYRLGKPPAYNAANKYPLVIFLHGSGESGTDNRLQISKNIGTNTPGSVFTTTANEAKFPTFFIAPQTPSANIGWKSGSQPLAAVLKLITSLEGEFSIDPNRLYVTGLSLGGMGTWTLIIENPTLFAAAIPMSGQGDTTMAAKISKIPIWDFHGAMDPAVLVKGSRDMIAAIRAAGGSPRYTEYPNGMHDIWFMAYNTPELLPWMNVQRLGSLDPTGDAAVPVIPDGGVPPGTGAAGAGGATDAGGAAGAGAAGAGGGGAGAGGGGAGAGGGGTTGAAGATGAAGGGAAGATATGGAGQGGGSPTGAAGATTGAAGMATTTGAAGTSGATGAAGTRGGSSGGCAVAGAGPGSSLLVGLAAVLLGAGLRSRRRRR